MIRGIFVVVALALLSSVCANPAGEVVKHGAADFVRQGNQLQVIQGTQNVVIEWDSFSIASGELTEFIQPGTNSAALNRVRGATASQIDGLLKANGRILLINPNGIVVGRGGQIDVGGFIASSLDVSDADFLAGGDLTFRGGAGSGAVVNLGSVRAGDGDVFLFAPRVKNAGSITAPNGTVGLGAGTKILLKATGSERVFVEGEGSVVNSGTVAANVAELKAHGGNVYAMAIKNSGRVVATGVSRQGGQVFLTGRGGKVRNTGTVKARRVKVEAAQVEIEAGSTIDASNDAGDGGEIILIGTESTVVNGSLSVVGRENGGRIQVEGPSLRIADRADIDASGKTGGGEIFLGGGFQGKNPDISNSDNTTVEAGAAIRANSLDSGDAGIVIVWADDATDFAGKIEARALGNSGNGGFAEVSGMIDLGFSGRVDTRGAGDGFYNGTLLLDPTDFMIGAVEAASITASLDGGMNVVIQTSGAGGGNGDIFVNSAITTNPGAAGSLDLLAHRHIEVNSDIQIDGTGRLQLIAGLDFSTAIFGGGGTPLVSFNDFGIDNGTGNGSVFINNGSTTGLDQKVAVGSRFGDTNIYGYDVSLTADRDAGGPLSNQGNHAMIGFFAHNQGLGFNIPGNILVEAKNDITLTPGNTFTTPAQIGHIGVSNILVGVPGAGVAGPEATATGSITVNSGGLITLNAGTGEEAYSQIGHGGSGVSGDVSGPITVDARAIIFMPSDSGSPSPPYMQIGHGGAFFDGTQSGDISISARTLVRLTGGGDSFPIGGDRAPYAQIGHGGLLSNGNMSGNIAIDIPDPLPSDSGSPRLELFGGTSSFGYAQIGHGGPGNTQTESGNIVITTPVLDVKGGSGGDTYARIGHGDTILSGSGPVIPSSGDRSGHIFITISDVTRLEPGTYFGATVPEIGHRTNGGTISNADVALFTPALGFDVSDFPFENTIDNTDFANQFFIRNLEGGDVTFATNNFFNLTIDAPIFAGPGVANDINIFSVRDISVLDSIQLDGRGNLSLVAGWDLATGFGGGYTVGADFDPTEFAGVGSSGFGNNNGSVFINDGGADGLKKVSVGSRSGETGVYGHDVILHGDNFSSGEHAMIGFFALRQGTGFNIPGNIVVGARNDVVLTPGSDFNTPAQIGHIGTSVIAGGVPGPVVVGADANASGSISVTAGNDVILNVSNAGFQNTYAQIGHGNSDAAGSAFGSGNVSGAITVSAGRDITLTGRADTTGGGDQPHVQIGHGGDGFDGTKGGNISLTATRNISVAGGTSAFAGDIGSYSLVGHGGNSSSGAITGQISMAATNGNITLSGGRDNGYAQVGHGGRSADSSADGAISVSGGGRLSFNGGIGDDASAQIGHGGIGSGNMKNGSILIDAFIVEMFSGTGRTQIGHAAINTTGTLSGDITINSGFVANLLGGTSSGAVAQIGHYSSNNPSSSSGAIDVEATGGMILQGGSTFDTNARIGHNSFDNDGAILVETGDLQVLGGSDRAGIGHDASFVAGSSSAGSITVNATGDITVQGGTGAAESVGQIGHQGQVTSGQISVSSDDLAIFSGGPVTAGRYQFGNFGKIGHGTDDITSATGNIGITVAGTTTMRAGTNSFDNYVQIGHGGVEFSDSPKTGDITLNTGSLILEKPAAGTEYALIGHGSQQSRNGSTTGDINIIAQDGVTVTRSQVGHATGGQRFGNTFVGVGQSDPATAGSGTLTADATSSFLSEPKDSNGELRFYAPTRDDVNIALGTNLNGVALAANDPYPNEQGFFTFGAGPYSGDFGFYFNFSQVSGDPAPPGNNLDETGILLPDDPGIDGPPIGNEDSFKVENEFYDDGGNDPFRETDPDSLFVAGDESDPGSPIEQSGFPIDRGPDGYPRNFEVPDGMVTSGFGIVSFGGENGDVVTAAAPPEVAAELGEHLSEQAHVVTIPDGMIGPDNELVSFGGNSNAIVESFDTAGKIQTEPHTALGALIDFGSALPGIPARVEIPDGRIGGNTGVVGFNSEAGVGAEMAPDEVAAALAEALGEAAHDGSVRGPGSMDLRAGDGVAEFGPGGTQIPQTVEQETDAVFGESLSPAAVAEMESAFGE